MAEIDFKRENPPQKDNGGGQRLSRRLAPQLDKLRADPATWYRLLVYTRPTGAARSLTTQVSDCEFTVRRIGETWVVYGRYVGEHGEAFD